MASFSTSDDCRSYNKVHRKLYFLIIRLYLQPTARSQLPRSFDMQLSCINISEYQDTFRYMHKYIHIYILSYLQIYIYIYICNMVWLCQSSLGFMQGSALALDRPRAI